MNLTNSYTNLIRARFPLAKIGLLGNCSRLDGSMAGYGISDMHYTLLARAVQIRIAFPGTHFLVPIDEFHP
jgi:hypothetical protein